MHGQRCTFFYKKMYQGKNKKGSPVQGKEYISPVAVVAMGDISRIRCTQLDNWSYPARFPGCLFPVIRPDFPAAFVARWKMRSPQVLLL
jgi:hypothetical protein